MRLDFLSFFMPGQGRPQPRAAEAAALAGRGRVAEGLERAAGRLDGLYALLEAGDDRDAALVAALAAEDLDAVAGLLGRAAGPPLAADLAGLGLLPGPDALAAFARRAEDRLVALRKALAAKAAREWATAGDRYEARAVRRARVAVVVVVVLVCAAMLLGETVARKRREFAAAVTLERQRGEAADALARLSDLSYRAKTATGRPLWEITGNNCSRCGCEGRDLRVVPSGDVCVRQWEGALSRLGQAAGADAAALARFARDPWGSPYLLNENEGESPDFPFEPDTLASAGQNGLAGDGDDITLAVPNAGTKR